MSSKRASDAVLRRELCYLREQVGSPSTHAGASINARALAEARTEAKKRGWKAAKIRRAERCGCR